MKKFAVLGFALFVGAIVLGGSGHSIASPLTSAAIAAVPAEAVKSGITPVEWVYVRRYPVRPTVYTSPRYVRPTVYLSPRYVRPTVYLGARYVRPTVYLGPRYVRPTYYSPYYVQPTYYVRPTYYAPYVVRPTVYATSGCSVGYVSPTYYAGVGGCGY